MCNVVGSAWTRGQQSDTREGEDTHDFEETICLQERPKHVEEVRA
jgi:hypothetical protein